MADTERITLNIGGQEFVLMVKPDERADVQEAADTVRGHIQDLARRGAVGISKQAVMTAFNLAFEQVRLARDPLFDPAARADLERRCDTLIRSIDQALASSSRDAPP